MKVSKVAVAIEERAKKAMVLMYRTSKEAGLVLDQTTDIRTRKILESKKDSFTLSIQNKTVLKDAAVKIPLCASCLGIDSKQPCKKCKEAHKLFIKNVCHHVQNVINQLLKGRTPDRLPTMTIEQIRLCLTEKFAKGMSYYPSKEAHEPTRFDLAELLFLFSKTGEKEVLKPYQDWVSWYICTKTKTIEESIRKNRIAFKSQDEGRLSLRRQALKDWRDEAIDLKHEEELYQIDLLIEDWKKITFPDIKGEISSNNLFAYHRLMKSVLQKHQSERVFGKRESPNWENRNNPQLRVYHAEVVKYLERYFPLKPSSRKSSQAMMQRCLDSSFLKNTIRLQIKNSVKLMDIQNQIAVFNKFDEQTTSETMSRLRREEAFRIQLSQMCTFAATNIHRIVNPALKVDILGKKNLRPSLDNYADGGIGPSFSLFYSFFPLLQEEEVNDRIEETIWALRGAVQKVRNKIFHFEEGDLLFNNPFFEIREKGLEQDFTTSIFKDSFEREFNDLQSIFAEQLKTGGVLSYYDEQFINAFLTKSEFSLLGTSQPFTPGFKRLFTQGCNYQHADRGKDRFYDLQLNHYFPQSDKSANTVEDPQAYEARRYLLKMIYQHLFLPKFHDKKERLFQESVSFVLRMNKAHAQAQPKNRYSYAFAEVPSMNNQESVSQYFAKIQRFMVLQTAKRAQENSDRSNHFDNFLLQIHIKGFDTFLQTHFGGKDHTGKVIIHTPRYQDRIAQEGVLDRMAKELAYNIKLRHPSINKDDSTQIGFYVFCKLLDANLLNTLRNELIKYIACQEKSLPHQDSLHHLLEIVSMVLLGIDKTPASIPSDYFDRITPFFAKDFNFRKCKLYCQSDQKTPILHAGIQLMSKYGSIERLKKLVEAHPRYKITQEEYKAWCSAEQHIADMVSKRMLYHTQWEASTKKKIPLPFSKEDYQKLVDEIDRYNWLDNKLHFVHLKKLHNLLTDLHSRMSGFVAYYNRDYPNVRGIQDRNMIAHNGYLMNVDLEDSLIDLLNKLRKLLGYDRKRKNAVAKSVINLFDKYGMRIEFVMEGEGRHELKLVSVTPKQITHLRDKEKSNRGNMKLQIRTNQVSSEFCELCSSLLEMK